MKCCASPCSHYVEAQRRGDLILWTDASFFPEHNRCAAAFGLECAKGIKISAFRVRGSAARGELLAIFAALKTFSQSERNLAVFSDCQSAIKKIENLISLAKMVHEDALSPPLSPSSPSPSPSPSPSSVSSPPPPPPSISPSFSSLSALSSTENRIYSIIQQILWSGRSLSLHWVKAHSGIIQNEMLDQAAKKEAQNKKRESLFEEIPEMMGELTIRDKIVESREEIAYAEWRPDLDKAVMKGAKSWMAKRVMAGIEQWRGLQPSWESPSHPKDCIHCSERHKMTFEYFVRKCPSASKFRASVEKIWEGVTWSDELFEGRVSKKQTTELGARGVREETVREGKERVRRWERALRELRKSLGQGRD